MIANLQRAVAAAWADLEALDGDEALVAEQPQPQPQPQPRPSVAADNDPRWLADELPLTEVAEMCGVLPDSMRWVCKTEGRGRPPHGHRRRWRVNPAEMRERFSRD